MNEKILLNQFENKIIKTPDAILIQRKPFGLIVLGLGVLVVAFLLKWISGVMQDEVLVIVVNGFSYLIGTLAAVFVAVGFYSMIPKVKNYLVVDLVNKKVTAKDKVYPFDQILKTELAPLGQNFLTLQMVLSVKPDILRIVTLPVSKLEILKQVQQEFDQIFAGPKANALASEKQDSQPFPTDKHILVFMLILGSLWVGICYFAFEGLAISSKSNPNLQIPFWSLGFLIMLIGLFNFFKKFKNKP